jgi:regulator of sigma E protease
VSYLLAFLGFAALIILHEFGHFLAAKAVGMRVERFSLFFGPLLVKTRRGETEYGIAPIPLGGYVRITGMNPNERLAEQDELNTLSAHLEQVRSDIEASTGADRAHADGLKREEQQLVAEMSAVQNRLAAIRSRAYYNQAVWKRVVVILAGPAVNLLIAFLIVWALFLSNGEGVVGKDVAAVEKGTPAAAALQPGDHIVSVDGVSTSPDTIRNQIDRHRCAGQQVNGCLAATAAKVVVRRDRQLRTFELRPQYSAKDGRMLLGFEFGGQQVPVGAGKAASLTVTALWDVTKLTVSKFATLFEPSSRKSIHSVVGAFKVTQQRFAFDSTEALDTLALISLSLAVINLFPFLPLDGGHVFWALAEKVRRKRIPFEVMERAGAVGFVLIILVFVIGLSNDISTLTGAGFKTTR